MRRIINLPKRGIGQGTIDKRVVAANEQGKTLWEIMEKASSYVGGKGGTQVENFATLIKSFRLTNEKKDAYDTASQIAKTSGLLKELYEDKNTSLPEHEYSTSCGISSNHSGFSIQC